MARILLYNIPEGEKLRRIRVALLRLGIPGTVVRCEDYGHPLGYLAGLEGFDPGKPWTGELFTEEMLLMSGLSSRQFSGLLDTLRASRVTVPLKAVLTESNAAWNSVRLRDALREEHETMRELLEQKKK